MHCLHLLMYMYATYAKYNTLEYVNILQKIEYICSSFDNDNTAHNEAYYCLSFTFKSHTTSLQHAAIHQ